MHPYTVANPQQIAAIRARAVNAITREIQTYGIALTHEQADSLGEECVNWLASRLGLFVTTNATHVLATPERSMPVQYTDATDNTGEF